MTDDPRTAYKKDRNRRLRELEAAVNGAEAELRIAQAENRRLRDALQRIVDGTMDEYVERVARAALAEETRDD